MGIRIDAVHLLPGFSAGLDEPTALADLEVPETLEAWQRERIHAGVAALHPDDPLPGVDDSQWPDAFLTSPAPAPEAAAWIVALTIAIQRWARDPVRLGRVVAVDGRRVRVALPWRRELLFRSALQFSAEVIDCCTSPRYDPEAIRQLTSRLHAGLPAEQRAGMTAGSLAFIEAAVARGIPVDIKPGYVQLGWAAHSERIDDRLTARTSRIAAALAADRLRSDHTLLGVGVPRPATAAVSDLDGAVEFANRVGWPVVVAPRTGDAAAVRGITDPAELQRAIAALGNPLSLIVEKHPPGDDHRLLIVNGRMAMATKRVGTTAVDVTADVHPDNCLLAERACSAIGLGVATVDVVCPDISQPWWKVGGAVCGVDAAIDDDVAGTLLDALFAGRSARIPTAAVTGTNGKSTTATMLHHIWTAAGMLTGVCTTSSVRIGDRIASIDNLSGLPGAWMILAEPTVQSAVFEMPRKGLLVFGHPCDRYDVAALLNIQDDHIGVDGVDTLEQMANLKAEVLERARHAVVINADDPLCMAVRHRSGTDRHILVSTGPTAVAEHRRSGGEAAFLDVRDDVRWIVLAAGTTEIPVMPVAAIPATMNGLLRHNESNALFAAATAWAQGVAIPVIRTALATFTNSRTSNPGRYNFVDGLPFRVLLDYSHNPDGVREVCAIAGSLPVDGRRILCSVTVGNRHPDHFTKVAPLMAGAFDQFMLGCDPSRISPGHHDPVAARLEANRAALLRAGVDAADITTEPEPATAIRLALGRARPGDLLVILADHKTALPVIDEAVGPLAGGETG